VTARHVDGNALGGLLIDLFGREMTGQDGCCDVCGAIGPLGGTIVYRDAPGDVVRCASCGAVLMVLIRHGADIRLSLHSLRWIELSSS
jgi:hypothetical protein